MSQTKYSDLEINDETLAIQLSLTDTTESAVMGTKPYRVAIGKKYSLYTGIKRRGTEKKHNRFCESAGNANSDWAELSPTTLTLSSQ